MNIRNVTLTVVVALFSSGCMTPAPADQAEVAPSDIVIEMSNIRALSPTSPYISFAGGFYDGAAAGQTTSTIVTPDDRVMCIFETVPVLDGDGPDTVTTAFDGVVSGAYGALLDALDPQPTSALSGSPNFIIELAPMGRATQTRLLVRAGEPNFAALADVFVRIPSPCWSFG